MYHQKSKLILASASPRRADLLASCGIFFLKDSADIDETPLQDETPQQMVERLSCEKARAVAQRHPDCIVLGADTTVVINGENLGKPTDADAAKVFLRKLQGQEHQVWGGLSLLCPGQGTEFIESYQSHVRMMPLTEDQIALYVATGEPLDKAGAYAIQGIGASLIEGVRGSYTNVVGLNLSAVIVALRKVGVL